MKKIFKLTVIIFCLAVFSCSKKEKDPSVEIDYIKAYKTLNDKGYSEAAKAFEKIEDDYPFSKWAAKSQTMAAYAYYKNGDYADVVRVVDDFVRINPSSEALDYMFYIKAMSYFDQISAISRAQDSAKEASMIFRELIARFPQSQYSVDSREKLIFVDEHLAGAKMSVGRYQISQENYVGALKNFQEVVWRYRQTNQVAEGYYRLFEIYEKLGLKSEAQKSYDNLIAQYPQSEWLKMAQKIKEKLGDD